MLKKQTVWLLTMLSLMIVLSAYYIMSDKENLAYIQTEGDMAEQTANQEDMDENDIDVENIKEVGKSEFLTMIRMELEDERNLKKDRLKDIVASSNATTTEINEALNEIDEIEKLGTKESILQDTILSKYNDFSDVLVRTDKDKVHVHVITDNLDKQEAVQIMQLVRDELGRNIPVDVDHQGATE
jgi:stage III sporulation protein AH